MASLSKFTGLAQANSASARTISKTITPGSVISIGVFVLIPAETVVPSDGVNTYTLRRSQILTNPGMILRVYEAVNAQEQTPGAPLVITLTPSAGMKWGAEAYEVLGVPTTSPLEVEGSTEDDTISASNAAAAPGLDIAAGSAAIAYYLFDRDASATGPTGWTTGANALAGDTIWSHTATKVFSSAATGERGLLASQITTRVSGILVAYKGDSAPIITGPTGAAGAASITHSALELQNVAGTWTATGSDAWSLTGTDAGLLTITGGVVTLTSGNFDYETKASYSFNVVRGSASQAVTLNITNVVEVSAPTKSTPTATSAIVGFTTDIAAGTAHAVLTLTNNQPSIAQIKAGQDHTGSSATTVSPADLTITSAGVKNFASVAVVSGTTRYGWIVHEANGIDSAVLATGPMYPGTGRPAAGVTASGGWTASTGADLGAVMAEDAPGSTAEFMSTPTLTGSFQDKDIPLTQPYPPGTYNNLRFSARNVGGAATARVSLLNAAGAVLATSGDQALTSGAFVTFTVGSVTITDTATQWRFSAKAP